MTVPELATSLSSLASIAILWCLAMGLYRSYRVDHFRNEMFALRNELFDLACDGRIAFDDEAYTTLRSMYNGYIRFGERLSLSALLFFRLSVSADELAYLREHVDFNRRFARLTLDLPGELVKELRSQKSRMHDLVAAQMVFGSPVLVAMLVPPAIMLLLMRAQIALITRLRIRLRRAVADSVDEVALAIGEISHRAA